MFLPAEEQREEFIRSDFGLVYMGSDLNLRGRPWCFGQVGGGLHVSFRMPPLCRCKNDRDF